MQFGAYEQKLENISSERSENVIVTFQWELNRSDEEQVRVTCVIDDWWIPFDTSILQRDDANCIFSLYKRKGGMMTQQKWIVLMMSGHSKFNINIFSKNIKYFHKWYSEVIIY